MLSFVIRDNVPITDVIKQIITGILIFPKGANFCLTLLIFCYFLDSFD